MKSLFCALIILLFISASYGQSRKTRGKEMKELNTYVNQWSEGSIMLSSNTELKGLIKYDDRSGVLSYQNGEDSRSFTCRSVTGFEFFDQNLNHQRIFLALQPTDEKGNTEMLHFFEVVKEYKDFAVLSKTDPLEFQRNTTYSPDFGQAISTSTVVSQTSTIFLMNNSGRIVPYIQQIEGTKVNRITSFNRDRNKLLSKKNALAEFVGTETYERLEQYATDNDLSFEYKDEFVKILTYYDQIRTE